MKRALQRAQSTDLEKGASSSSPSSLPPPTKITRLASAPASITVSAPPAHQINRDGPEPDGWFIKHQNSALVAELRGFKREINCLVRERDERRKISEKALEGVRKLSREWRNLEIGVGEKLGGQEIVQRILQIEKKKRRVNRKVDEKMDDGDNDNDGDDDDFEIGVDIDERKTSRTHPLDSGEEEKNDMVLHEICRVFSSFKPHPFVAESKDDYDDDIGDSDDDGQDPTIFLARESAALGNRAEYVSTGIQNLLKNVNTPTPPASSSTSADNDSALLNSLSEIDHLKTTLSTVLSSRTEALRLARRANRKLDRLATGQSLSAVLDDEGKRKLKENEKKKEEAAKSANANKGSGDNANEGDGDGKTSAEDAMKLQQLEDLCSHRMKKIEELANNSAALENRITQLTTENSKMIDAVTSGDGGSSSTSRVLMEITNKLKATEAQLRNEKELNDILKPQYSVMEGKLQQSEKALSEVEAQNSRRWEALLAEKDGRQSAMEREIVTLKHKLHQSLEGARLAETVKSTLNETRLLAEKLQNHNTDLKKKNTELTKKKSEASGKAAAKKPTGKETVADLLKVNTDLRKKLGEQNATNDSLILEVRKLSMWKRTPRTSHEIYQNLTKNLLEHSNKPAQQIEALVERFESVSQSNLKLLKENDDKDKTNTMAKSEIIKLRQLNEVYKDERLSLLRQVKDAEELGTASRRAVSLGEKIREEMIKQEEVCEGLQSEMVKVKNEAIKVKAVADEEQQHLQATLKALEEDKVNLVARCDELTKMNGLAANEKTQLEEKIMLDARKNQNNVGLSGSADADVKLLLQQNSILKGKLTCHVCNTREKDCIITRCNHMFCKQCIENNLSLRKRNCPACNTRYSDTDVKDIWLTG